MGEVLLGWKSAGKDWMEGIYWNVVEVCVKEVEVFYGPFDWWLGPE